MTATRIRTALATLTAGPAAATCVTAADPAYATGPGNAPTLIDPELLS
ncbi:MULTISPECIES: hypothetical protein [unclassified Streptomyces]